MGGDIEYDKRVILGSVELLDNHNTKITPIFVATKLLTNHRCYISSFFFVEAHTTIISSRIK